MDNLGEQGGCGNDGRSGGGQGIVLGVRCPKRAGKAQCWRGPGFSDDLNSHLPLALALTFMPSGKSCHLLWKMKACAGSSEALLALKLGFCAKMEGCSQRNFKSWDLQSRIPDPENLLSIDVIEMICRGHRGALGRCLLLLLGESKFLRIWKVEWVLINQSAGIS